MKELKRDIIIGIVEKAQETDHALVQFQVGEKQLCNKHENK